MFARLRAAGLVIPTIMTLVMLPVLIALGAWQLERKVWKEDMIARLAAGRTAEPVSLAEVSKRHIAGDNIEYTRVRVTGTFEHGSERHVYAPREHSQGFDVYTVLNSSEGRVYVYRGWVPDKLKDPASRAEGQITGEVTVTGLARVAETAGSFTLPDDPKTNRWYLRDPSAFERNGVSVDDWNQIVVERKQHGIAPFSIDAEAEPANPGGWPKPTPTEIRLANRHLEYVVTWWGLAVTLIFVYALFVRQRLRRTTISPSTT